MASAQEIRLEEHKNQVIKVLSVQFSQNALAIDEYERLLDYINRVESDRELAIVEKVIEETALYAGEQHDNASPRKQYHTKRRKRVTLTLLADRNFVDESLQAGRSVLTVLGHSRIRIQKEDLSPGTNEVRLVSILGQTEIIVPRDVTVIAEAIPILGEVFMDRKVSSRKSPGCPELVITGGAYLGSITIKTAKESLKDKIEDVIQSMIR